MTNFVATVIIILILGAAIGYIVKAKKRGVKCVGCSDAGECAHKAQETTGCGGCGCGCHSDGQ